MNFASIASLLFLSLSCVQLQTARINVKSTILDTRAQTIPDWLFDVKDTIVQAIGSDGWSGYAPTEGVVPKWALQLKLEKMETLSMDALEYDLLASDGFIGVNITDFRMTMRIYLEELRLIGLLDLRRGGSLGNSFVDAFVKGGLRAGYETKGRNDFTEVCDEVERLLVFPQLHMRAGFNWLDRLNPIIRNLVRTITCWKVKSKLTGGKEALVKRPVFTAFMQGLTRTVNATSKLLNHFLHVEKAEQAIHLGEKCARKGCSKGGPCAYCGVGYCCKKGSFAGGCNGDDGDAQNFVCVNAPPIQLTPQNLGKECWKAAKCHSGRCGYCGSGFCCRLGKHGGECSGEVGDRANHVCVSVPYADADEKQKQT